jgi:hypothetical protein
MLNLFWRQEEKRLKHAFESGKMVGYEEGFKEGLRSHFHLTSELTDEEYELLYRFLVRHNFVLCYDLNSGGFRVRKNDRINPQPEKRIIVKKDYVEGFDRLESISLIEKELKDLQNDTRLSSLQSGR